MLPSDISFSLPPQSLVNAIDKIYDFLISVLRTDETEG